MVQPISDARSQSRNHVHDSINPTEKLQQGEQRLYSFYAPGLEVGPHTIDVKQEIHTDPDETSDNSNTLILHSTQTFSVDAPRYTLPAGSIHSTYPAPGRGEPARTLPHVVLNYPHLPWERGAGGDVQDDSDKNRVPWLAVLVFSRDELRLDEKLLTSGSSMFPGRKDVTQNTTLAINMTIADLLATGNDEKTVITPINEQDCDKSATVDVIFLKKGLFTSLVTTYKAGKPVNQSEQKKADVSRYKFLAHARQVSTKGMAITNTTGEAFFSVVISHRVGPLGITDPTPVVVHLVSIEGVGTMDVPLPEAVKFVGLISLHSWTYNCMPPGSLDTRSSFQHLGNTLDLLRAPKETIWRLKNPRACQRLTDGYSLVRYITQTGEQTVALTRGPFTPTTVQHPLRPDWGVSTFGTDLQILDTELGIMDITYSSAWQLGKALALADHQFAAALSRVRTLILDKALNNSKVSALCKRNPNIYKDRVQGLESLTEAILGLHRLAQSGTTASRSLRSPGPTNDHSHGSDLINATLGGHCFDAARLLSMGTDGQIYNEFNTPCSTDWMMIFSWILDRMYLVNVPAHYLITDPTHLPPESLRFFHIDANWVDALVDGALSIANHVQCYDGKVRTVIKKMVNIYLGTPHSHMEFLPQIPTYGFLLRSDLCSQFPDLVVEAEMPPHKLGASILYHKNIDKGVMLCLFDRVPSSEEFESLTFTQPPHQQCFSAGYSLDKSGIKMEYQQPYKQVDSNPNRAWENLDSETKSPVFLWADPGCPDLRTLLMPELAKEVFEFNNPNIGNSPTGTPDTHPGAALLGIQLGSAIFKLRIDLDKRLERLLPAGSSNKARFLYMLDKITLNDTLEKSPIPIYHQVHTSPRPSLSRPPRRTSKPQAFAFVSQSSDQRKASPGIHYPIFNYRVYSAHSPLRQLLMTGKQDLVFSIVLESGGGNDMDLEKLVLHVPLGRATDCCPTLMQTYDGPVKMLGNLRFNVLSKLSKDTLSLTLLPRSTTRRVSIKHVDEMSFLMSLAEVNVYTDRMAEVTISVEEKYWDPNFTLMSKFVVPMIQKPKSPNSQVASEAS